MKKRWRADACLVLCGVLVWFLADAVRVRQTAAEALALCAGSVIPALFPFLTVSRLLVAMGFSQWVSPLFSGLMAPLFRLPGLSGSALLLGLVGGYPIGAQTAAELYRENLLTRGEAVRLLTFCNNSNPVFLISVLGVGVFGSVRAGVWLWLIHVSAALLTGLLCRGSGKAARDRRPAGVPPCQPSPLSAAFVAAVRDSAAGMLSVCAFVVFFYVLAAPLKALGPRLGPLLVGAVELFSLTPLLTPDRLGFILAAGCAGWGGLSVLCQTAAVVEDLPLAPCVLGKLLHGLLSALLAALLAGYALA